MAVSVGPFWWAKALISVTHIECACWQQRESLVCSVSNSTSGLGVVLAELCDGVMFFCSLENLKNASLLLALSEYLTVWPVLSSTNVCSNTTFNELTGRAWSFYDNSAISSKSFCFALLHEQDSVSKTIISTDNPLPSFRKELPWCCECKYWGPSRCDSTTFAFAPF